MWKTFKTEFAAIEENLTTAKEEVEEEIKLASEQAAHDIRHLQMIEFEENKLHRQEQAYEVMANKDFRSQQAFALQQGNERQIQKLIKEEGKAPNFIYGRIAELITES